MKKFLLCLALAAGFCKTAGASVLWQTDVPLAVNIARVHHRFVLLDFTGSDWCGWCRKLKGEVFDQPEFAAYAGQNLVMVEVDFPREKRQSDELAAANRKLQKEYGVEGYPTIIVLDDEGRQLGKLGYTPGGPKAFIARLEALTGIGKLPPADSAAAIAETKTGAASGVKTSPAPAIAMAGVSGIALKGISGARDKRLAMINNATLMTGETGKVKVRDQRVEVTVKEIRDDSVLVVIDGKTSELRMAEH